jgi:hypothetical protein
MVSLLTNLRKGGKIIVEFEELCAEIYNFDYTRGGREALSEEYNEKAKQALCIFLTKYKKMKTTGENTDSLYYLVNFFQLLRALREKRYNEACSELTSSLRRDPFWEERIRRNVVNLLERYLL